MGQLRGRSQTWQDIEKYLTPVELTDKMEKETEK